MWTLQVYKMKGYQFDDTYLMLWFPVCFPVTLEWILEEVFPLNSQPHLAVWSQSLAFKHLALPLSVSSFLHCHILGRT